MGARGVVVRRRGFRGQEEEAGGRRQEAHQPCPKEFAVVDSIQQY